MLRHIVLFKFKEGIGDGDKGQLVMLLKALEHKVDEVRELEVGVDVGRKGKSYDIGLSVTFDSLADMEAYSIHADHVSAVEFIDSICESVTKVDYEF